MTCPPTLIQLADDSERGGFLNRLFYRLLSCYNHSGLRGSVWNLKNAHHVRSHKSHEGHFFFALKCLQIKLYVLLAPKRLNKVAEYLNGGDIAEFFRCDF